MIVINDLHIGAVRTAGTTPVSAGRLREYLLTCLENTLSRVDEDLVVLGDLFDTHTVAMSDLLNTYMVFKNWLTKGHKLWLVAGNHDLSKDSSKLSSFQFLGKLLGALGATYIEGSRCITDDVYVISHVPNQDLFDMELAKVPQCQYLLVHANYDNDFAAETDHSLNVSKEVAENLPVKTIFFAHEHYYRKMLNGKVFVGGNQFPSSISDCLKQVDKFMHRLGDSVERIKVWDAAEYVEVDWKDVGSPDAKFIRVVGNATAEESASAMEAVAQLRKVSQALVVGNGIKVAGSDAQDSLNLASFEEIKAFDVMSALEEYLSVEEMKKIRNLK